MLYRYNLIAFLFSIFISIVNNKIAYNHFTYFNIPFCECILIDFLTYCSTFLIRKYFLFMQIDNLRI